jgi:hypothetical protein
MADTTTKGLTRLTLADLASSDLACLCLIFRLKVGGSRKTKIERLLNQDEVRIERLLVFARLIRFGYWAESHISKDHLRDILDKHKLPVSGNKHALYITLMENGKLSASEILDLMGIRGIREVYADLFDKPAVDDEGVLRAEILAWVTAKTKGNNKAQEGAAADSRSLASGKSLEPSGPWGVPRFRAQSAGSVGQTEKEEGTKETGVREYDAAISYASEDKTIAKELAERMKLKQIRVFFDEFYKADLWGKSLSARFRESFGENTEFVLVLLSKHYAVKNWTDFEFSIARGEAKNRKEEFILPVRLDDTIMVGLRSDVCYLDYRKDGFDGIVEALMEKLRQRRETDVKVKSNIFHLLIPHLGRNMD